MKPAQYTPRIFAGTWPPTVMCTEDAVAWMGVTPQASAAFDIIADSGYPDLEVIWQFVIAAERKGWNPEHWARHFVKIRNAARAAADLTA